MFNSHICPVITILDRKVWDILLKTAAGMVMKMLNCYYNLEKDEGKVHVSGYEHSFKVRIEGLK